MADHSASVQSTFEGTIDLWPTAPAGGWRRVLLKLSGEAFAGEGSLGVDPDVVSSIAVNSGVVATGIEVAVVIGGGNVLSRRGAFRARNGARAGRLHGHARYRHELSRPSGLL